MTQHYSAQIIFKKSQSKLLSQSHLEVTSFLNILLLTLAYINMLTLSLSNKTKDWALVQNAALVIDIEVFKLR